MQLQADQARFLFHDVYFPGLKNEHRITKSVVGAIPADKCSYRPDPVSQTALELAWHIVSTELRFMDAVARGKFDLSPRPRPDSIANSADLVTWYAENFDSQVAELAKVTDDTLSQIVDFRGIFQLPGVMYLGFVTNHSIHHRGQLSSYLRPMGAKVPAIYGESYDSKLARNAG